MNHKNAICTSLLTTIFLAVLVQNVSASPGLITRTVSPDVIAPGGELVVTLDIDVSSGERFYIIDEAPPTGWTIVDKGSLVQDSEGHLKFVKLQNAADKTFQYTLKAPESEGEYQFGGIYQIDKMDAPAEMSGDEKVTVQKALEFQMTYVIIGVLIVAILAVILYLKKTQS